MRPLSELPHRLWPSDRQPADYIPPNRAFNLRSADFKKAYTTVVNPRLKAAGFRCSGTIGRREGPNLSEATWFLASSGEGQLVIAAHPRDFPTRPFWEPTSAFDYVNASFKRALDLCPDARTRYGRGHCMLDLGRNAAEGIETAEVFAELFEAQGLPYLAELATAVDRLLAVDAASFDAKMPDLVTRLGLCPYELMPVRTWQILLVASLQFKAGHLAETKALCELGLATNEPGAAAYGRLLERLARGLGPLHLTAEDRRG